MPSDHTPTQCVVVDDHVMLLDLLVGVLRTVPGLVVATTATDVTDAGRIAAIARVDLLIVDRRLPSGDGMELVRAVRDRHPRVQCIVIAGATTDFVCPPDLLDCVVSVIDKARACDALLTAVARVTGRSAVAAGDPGSIAVIRSRLTPREFELFTIMGEGLSNKELGQRIGISTRTVETHRKAISRKLGRSGAALVRLATLHRHGGLTPDLRVHASAGPSR
ncbi:MAG: response regulator [Planctomycetaceae bacterium]